MIVLNLHQETTLNDQLNRSREESVTYVEVGGTQVTDLPHGYRHDRLTSQVGSGDTDWERAKQAIQLWKAHEHARIGITPADARPTEGATVLASRSFGPLMLLAPCRIVYRTDEPTRFGFAYGTLPGHPEQGEEAFHVILHEDGNITVEIVAFSRPADLSTKLGGPLARQIQKATTRRYLEGIAGHVAAST